MYKYFTWTDNQGYHKGQDLLERSQITTLLGHIRKPSEAYATIQDYDERGNCIGCPIYFDIDSPSLMEAYNNASELFYDLWTDFEVEPLFYFSGSKGFHIIVPRYIRHPRCHEIAAMIASEYKNDCDESVYRTRSMWRCENTWNAKGKTYKTLTNEEEMLAGLLERAKEISEPICSKYRVWKDLDINGYVNKLPERKIGLPQQSSRGETMMPCMQTLWAMEEPPEGQRHYLCFAISRWCYKSGLDANEVIQLFREHPFWKNVRERDYEKVIDSVYRSGKTMIGCESGRDAELLRPYCVKICAYNKEFDPKEVFRNE